MKTPRQALVPTVALIAAFLSVSLVAGGLLAGLLLPAVAAGGTAARSGLEYFDSLPGDLTRPPLAEQSTLLDATGKPIAHFYDEHRISVPLKNIAPAMRNAIIAIEDSRFYQHGGVDPKGLIRAFLNNQVSSDSSVQGASTLTQQYVKNVLLESAVANKDKAGQKAAVAVNYGRKLQEIRMAMELEKKLSKDEILTNYLNIANFGDGTYGVEAAAQYFYGGTSAAKLTIPQAAMLAGLVQSPATHNPFDHPESAMKRRNAVLDRMSSLGMISDKEFQAAVKTPLGVKRNPSKSGCVGAGDEAYFCSYIQELIKKDDAFSALGKTPEARRQALRTGGLTIKSTLNPRIQAAAFKAVTDRVPIGKDNNRVSSSAITVEPGTGKVLAMTQNRIYSPDNSDRLTYTTYNYNVDGTYQGQGVQTGSAFKAITLAAWLEDGRSLYDVVDGAVDHYNAGAFEDCDGNGTGAYDHVGNSASGENRPWTVVDATAQSVNTVYVAMEKRVGLCNVAKMAGKLGVHTAEATTTCSKKPTTEVPDCVPSLTLGVLDIAPLTMANAYATFAADGTLCEPLAVTSITDRDGKAIPVPAQSCKQAIDPDVARGVTFALKRVLTDGTASGSGIGRPAAGKTGTNDGPTSTWFVGYTPQLSTAVWVGDITSNVLENPRSQYLNGREIGGKRVGNVFGASIAAPIWQRIMDQASEGLPEKDWEGPPGSMRAGSQAQVPNVLGQPLAIAQAVLRGKGFQVETGDAAGGGGGFVAQTDPAPGSVTEPGGTVTLIPGGPGGGTAAGQWTGNGRPPRGFRPPPGWRN